MAIFAATGMPIASRRSVCQRPKRDILAASAGPDSRCGCCLLPVLLAGALWCTGAQADNGGKSAAASPYRLDSRLRANYALKGYWGPTAKLRRTTLTSQMPSGKSLLGQPFGKEIERAAREADVDPALVHAIVFVESRYNAKARSPKGAVGLMQVLPQTAARFGIRDPGRSPEANLAAGTRYLRALMTLFNNRLDLVLAAYNAGENSVLGHGRAIPPYAETRAYVPAVLSKYREWRGPDQSSERQDARRTDLSTVIVEARNGPASEGP